MNNPLTMEKFTQMVAAVQQIGTISNNKIKSPADDAALSGQKAFLSRALAEHSGELLQAWHVMKSEYTPLVTGFCALQERANQLRAERDRQFAEAMAAQQPKEGTAVADPNIIAPDFVKPKE